MGKTAIQVIRLFLAICITVSNWRVSDAVQIGAPLAFAAAWDASFGGVLDRIQADKIVQEDTPADFEDVVQRAQQMAPLFSELYAHLDRNQFDLDDLNITLNYDAAAIVDFVAQEIAFEQYPGVLRGELGTLIGRAGNAADQALLLRRLLDDAGYETRLVRGTLSQADAAALVNQMALPRSEPPPAIDPTTLDDVLNQVQALVGAPVPDASDSPIVSPYEFYQAATESDTQIIFEALEAAEIQLGEDSLMDKLVEEARDYFWVQYRLSVFEPWIDAHPAFADSAGVLGGIAVEEIFRDALPLNLHHRLRLEVFIEQKQADALVVHPLLTGWERTAAELVGSPITFTNRPNNLDLDTLVDLETMLADANVFLPVVNGEIADRAFDGDGNPFSIALVGPGTIGATALLQSAAAELEEITGDISNLGETPEADSGDLPADGRLCICGRRSIWF